MVKFQPNKFSQTPQNMVVTFNAELKLLIQQTLKEEPHSHTSELQLAEKTAEFHYNGMNSPENLLSCSIIYWPTYNVPDDVE